MATDGIDEDIPTARAAEGIGVHFDLEGDVATFIFIDGDKQKFTLTGSHDCLPFLFTMVSNLIMQWHRARPDLGVFFHKISEGLVSSSDELRGHVMIQFDHGMGFMVESETALKLARLIEQHVKNNMTDDEWSALLKKQAPMIVQPRQRIIRPS